MPVPKSRQPRIRTDPHRAAPVFGNKGIADGPEVRLTESRTIPQVIHPSLLEDPFEKASLKYYTTGQLVLIEGQAARSNH